VERPYLTGRRPSTS